MGVERLLHPSATAVKSAWAHPFRNQFPHPKAVLASTKLQNQQPQQQQQPSLTLQEFVQHVPESLSRLESSRVPPGSDHDPVLALFRRLQTNQPDQWLPYCHVPDEHCDYTRNLIATDSLQKNYTILLLCWKAGKCSPIHNHPHAKGCWMQVLSGSIVETRYNPDTFKVRSKSMHTVGQTLFMDDSLGYHSIANPNTTTDNDTSLATTTTLHLYSPPIETCDVVSDIGNNNGQQPKTTTVCAMHHHSEYGYKVTGKGYTL